MSGNELLISGDKNLLLPIMLIFSVWSFMISGRHSRDEKVLVAHFCPTLCNPMDYSLPGSSVHGILQGRILERVAMPFSRGSSLFKDQKAGSPTLQPDSLPSKPPGKSFHVLGLP